MRVFGDQDVGNVGVPFVPLAEFEEGGVGVDWGSGDLGGGVDGEEAAFGDCWCWSGAGVGIRVELMVCVGFSGSHVEGDGGCLVVEVYCLQRSMEKGDL